MATAKAFQAERMNKAADRLDWLMANARVLRSPALWEKYYEAVRMAGLLGFQVSQEGGRHRVTPC